MNRLKTTETGLKTPGWQVLLKDSASVLNGVLGGDNGSEGAY